MDTENIQESITQKLLPFKNTKNTQETRRAILSTLMDIMPQIICERGAATINDIEVEVKNDPLDPTMINIVATIPYKSIS